MAAKHHQQQQHFLIVTYPAQGHITPARHLARRLARACSGARATVCVPLSAFRKMFPGGAAAATAPEEESGAGAGDDPLVRYAAYSDGYDGGFDAAADSYADYMSSARASGSRSLSAVLRRLRAGGRPVTCAVYTLLLPWVSAVARAHGVAATAVFWIQPATALAAYFHYFRGHRDAVVSAAAASGDASAVVAPALPGLPPLRVRDLPSFLAVTDDHHPFAFVLPAFRELVDAIERDGDKPQTFVLANTCDAMEPDALASLRPHVDIFAVGPVLSFLHDGGGGGERAASSTSPTPPPRDVFEHDETSGYIRWLDTKPARSVVYISFGSSTVVSEEQAAEIAAAMAQVRRPFLWVLRKDNRRKDHDDVAAAIGGGGGGMVVEWCDQARVLAHGAVACFVTHCGWNSTLEAAACGVPAVAVPQYSDQGTAAWVVTERMRAGVRAVAAGAGGGVVEADELRRCVEAAVSSEDVAASAAAWRREVRAAVAPVGSSDRELAAFLRRIDHRRGDGDD